MSIEEEIDRYEYFAASTAHLDDEAKRVFWATISAFREKAVEPDEDKETEEES